MTSTFRRQVAQRQAPLMLRQRAEAEAPRAVQRQEKPKKEAKASRL